MVKISLTEHGKAHCTDYLQSAIERIVDMKQRAGIAQDDEMLHCKLARTLDDLERVRLMLYIGFGPTLPSNAVKTAHDGPEDLPF